MKILADGRVPFEDAIADPHLFKNQFEELSAPQKVLLKVFYGMPLSETELPYWAMFQGRCRYDELGYPTEFYEWPYTPKKYSDLFAIIGRRGAKTHIATMIVAYEALLGGHYSYVKTGQDCIAYYIAQDLPTAKSQLKLVKSFIRDSKLLETAIKRESEDELELDNGITIVASSPSIRRRGAAVPILVGDELAFWRNETNSANPDKEVWNAVRYAMGQFPNAIRVGISSPWVKQGLMWSSWNTGTEGEKIGTAKAKTQHEGLLVCHAPSAAMLNPRMKRDVYQKEFERDSEIFRRESLAQFIDAVSGFLPEAVIRQAITKNDMPTRKPQLSEGFQYVAAMDPAFRNDSFAFCIVHKDRTNDVIVDAILRWTPEKGTRLNPSHIIREITTWLGAYGIQIVVSDQYQLETLQQLAQQYGWAIDGIQFTSASKAKIYGNLATLFNVGKIKLLDPDSSRGAAELVEELTRLEQKRTAGGSVQIGAPEGSHDDMVSALALACERVLQISPKETLLKQEEEVGIFGQFLKNMQEKQDRRYVEEEYY